LQNWDALLELDGVFEGRAGTSDRVGNTLATARTITISSTPSFSIDFVGTSDPDDYYQFVLNQRSIVTIGFTSTPNTVAVDLLRSGGQILESRNTTVVNRATTNIIPAESVSGFELSAGTYFLHFKQLAGNSNHAFAIKTFTFPITLSQKRSIAFPNYHSTARRLSFYSESLARCF
jgi:hypothetical protein